MRARPPRSAAIPVACGLLALLAGGCRPGPDPVVRKAQAAFRDVMAQDPQFAQYGLEVAGRSTAPFARELLVESAGSENYQIALAAVRSLAREPRSSDVEVLRASFENQRGALKVWSAYALGRLEDPAALEWLRGQVGAVTGETQEWLVSLLAERDGQDAVLPLLRRKMESEAQGERDEAYATLARIGTPWATGLLREGLAREHGEGRRAAIRALGRSGDPAIAKELVPFINTRGLVFDTLEALGELGSPDAARAVRGMLRADQPRVRVYAAVALWKLGALEDPAGTLGPLAEVEDPRTRETLATQLGRVDDPAALPLLRTLASDPDETVRAAAVRALVERGGDGTLEVLLERLEDPEYGVATAALEGLGRRADAGVLPRIEPLLEDDNPYVVLAAANAILEIRARAG